MKTITLFACAAALGFAFSNPASAQDLRFGVGVRVGSGHNGFSFNIGVNDRHDRWERFPRQGPPPFVIVSEPPCLPPVVVAEPCHAPFELTVSETVGFRDERYISGYTKGCQLVWDRQCRSYRRVEVDVPVYSIRQVPVTVTRVVTASWCSERVCYGYTDRQGCFQTVQR